MAMDLLSHDDDFNSEINTTPLVDVMLVLLVIFIITLPVTHHNVNINLPRAAAKQASPTPNQITLSIDAQGNMYWNKKIINMAQLPGHVAKAAQSHPQPELHLRVERTTPFEKVAQIMAIAQSGGLNKMGFVTHPTGSEAL